MPFIDLKLGLSIDNGMLFIYAAFRQYQTRPECLETELAIVLYPVVALAAVVLHFHRHFTEILGAVKCLAKYLLREHNDTSSTWLV
jgi:hypothetical protein